MMIIIIISHVMIKPKLFLNIQIFLMILIVHFILCLLHLQPHHLLPLLLFLPLLLLISPLCLQAAPLYLLIAGWCWGNSRASNVVFPPLLSHHLWGSAGLGSILFPLPKTARIWIRTWITFLERKWRGPALFCWRSVGRIAETGGKIPGRGIGSICAGRRIAWISKEVALD